MNRKILTVIAIVIQLIVLGSFIIRYETLKSTGTTLYIPLRGYDPTDIFRGDYVNLAYELPYSGSTVSNYGENQYLVPKMQGNMILGVQSLGTTRPDTGIYFQIKNGGGNQQEIYTVKTGSGDILTYSGRDCLGKDYKVGDTVYYPSYEESGKVIYSISKKQESKIDTSWKSAKILTKSACTGTYRFQTTAADRWFVKEGTGLIIEKKIQEGNMYAQWKVGGNGAVIITNLVSKEELPK
ncbi:GDYXXLXY domain-containing protein [Candidatus Gracilibacteria bacterium]|nr:GDYXXLXY domain-containing protein [Candidatus Gracilibacteria bacterium]